MDGLDNELHLDLFEPKLKVISIICGSKRSEDI